MQSPENHSWGSALSLSYRAFAYALHLLLLFLASPHPRSNPVCIQVINANLNAPPLLTRVVYVYPPTPHPSARLSWPLSSWIISKVVDSKLTSSRWQSCMVLMTSSFRFWLSKSPWLLLKASSVTLGVKNCLKIQSRIEGRATCDRDICMSRVE